MYPLTGAAYLSGTLLFYVFLDNVCYRIFPVFRASYNDHKSYCHRFTVINRCLFYPILEEAIYTLPFLNSPKRALLFSFLGIVSSYAYTGNIHLFNVLALLNAYPCSREEEVFTLLRFLSGIRFALDHRMNGDCLEMVRVWCLHGSFYFMNWLVSYRVAAHYQNEDWKITFPLLSHIANNCLFYFL